MPPKSSYTGAAHFSSPAAYNHNSTGVSKPAVQALFRHPRGSNQRPPLAAVNGSCYTEALAYGKAAKQDRVQAATQLKGHVPVNKGGKYCTSAPGGQQTRWGGKAKEGSAAGVLPAAQMPIQRKLGFEYEIGGITPRRNTNWFSFTTPTWKPMAKGEVIQDKGDYQITADVAENDSNNLEFITRPFDENDGQEQAAIDTVAKSIHADINEITGHAQQQDVPLKLFSRISGASDLYLRAKDDNPKGQLQMTGGVDLGRLPGLLSGEELGVIPEGNISVEDTHRMWPLQNTIVLGWTVRLWA